MAVRVDAVQARHLSGLGSKTWETRWNGLLRWFGAQFGWDWVRRSAREGFIEAIREAAPYR